MKKKSKPITPKEEDTYLTPVELSKRLKVHVRTLSNWRDRSYGPRFKKLGHSIRYPVKAVLDWELKPGGKRA